MPSPHLRVTLEGTPRERDTHTQEQGRHTFAKTRTWSREAKAAGTAAPDRGLCALHCAAATPRWGPRESPGRRGRKPGGRTHLGDRGRRSLGKLPGASQERDALSPSGLGEPRGQSPPTSPPCPAAVVSRVLPVRLQSDVTGWDGLPTGGFPRGLGGGGGRGSGGHRVVLPHPGAGPALSEPAAVSRLTFGTT